MNIIKNKFTAYCERHSFQPKSLLSFVAILLVVVIGLGFFSLQRTKFFSQPTALGLKDIGELATQAGYIRRRRHRTWQEEMEISYSKFLK